MLQCHRMLPTLLMLTRLRTHRHHQMPPTAPGRTRPRATLLHNLPMLPTELSSMRLLEMALQMRQTPLDPTPLPLETALLLRMLPMLPTRTKPRTVQRLQTQQTVTEPTRLRATPLFLLLTAPMEQGPTQRRAMDQHSQT
jgi:hypothetical protein